MWACFSYVCRYIILISFYLYVQLHACICVFSSTLGMYTLIYDGLYCESLCFIQPLCLGCLGCLGNWCALVSLVQLWSAGLALLPENAGYPVNGKQRPKPGGLKLLVGTMALHLCQHMRTYISLYRESLVKHIIYIYIYILFIHNPRGLHSKVASGQGLHFAEPGFGRRGNSGVFKETWGRHG